MNNMNMLWIALAFVAGGLFGAVAMSLLAAGNRAEQDFTGMKLPDNGKKDAWT